MYNLFTLNPPKSFAVMYPANWNAVRTGLLKNLEKSIYYYHHSVQAVKSDHILASLLLSISISKHLPIERYYDNVDGLSSLNLSMTFGMTSSIYNGRVFKGAFYGRDSTELLIAHTESFDPFRATSHWKQLRPVRILRHPFSDLTLLPPVGTATGSEYGLSVIAINVPMLAVMWRSFFLAEEALSNETGDNPRGVGHFLHMYVLPNALPSHLDYALFNRTMNLVTGAPMGKPRVKPPFLQVDWAPKVDAVLTTQLGNLAKQTRDFAGILQNLPGVVQPTMARVMEVPEMFPTRQVRWALDVARLPMVDLLTRLAKAGGDYRNTQELNKLHQAVRNYESNHTFTNILPRDVAQDVFFEINEILARTKT